MRVLVTGSCKWKKSEKVFKRLSELPSDTTIIHGCAVGVDTMAGKAAEILGYEVEEFPPGSVEPRGSENLDSARNRGMTEANPDICIAFWNGTSHGTFHTMYESVIRGIPVEVVME